MKYWAALRLALGWIFLWAFLDKLLGLGFATTIDKAWVAGVSPTASFLQFATKGPFAGFFQSLAGNGLVDVLYMAGLLFVGTALMLGIFVKLASKVGIVMLALFYLAGSLPPQHNPFLDEHIIYIIVLGGIGATHAGRVYGMGERWARTTLVRNHPYLE
jgi:thiosulfate dehydrogenase (quinone) large subunit